MPDLNFEFQENYTSVQVNCALRPRGGLNLYLLQLPASIDEALEALSRPTALNVLRNLLEAGPDGAGPLTGHPERLSILANYCSETIFKPLALWMAETDKLPVAACWMCSLHQVIIGRLLSM